MNGTTCPECGAAWGDGLTCADRFNQMLAYEFSDPRGGVVHHLTVLAYHLQHPSLLSAAGWEEQRGLLATFVEDGITTDAMLTRVRAKQAVAAKTGVGKTSLKRGTPRAPLTTHWPMTITDATTDDLDAYAEQARAWARSVHQRITALTKQGALPTT